MFYHSITEFVFLMNILGKRSNLPFSRKSDRKKEKSTVSFTHEQNIICSQTQLDSIAHEQTIICGQLFASHVVGSRSMKGKKNLLQMIIIIIFHCVLIIQVSDYINSIVCCNLYSATQGRFQCLFLSHRQSFRNS